MAGTLSNYLNNKILNLVFGGTAYSPPAILYLGLYTVAPTSAGGGTEVTGGNYARKAVTANTTNFPTTTTQIVSLAVLQNFATATAAWGSIVALGVFDAATAGNLLAWDDFTATVISSTDVARVPVAGLTVALS